MGLLESITLKFMVPPIPLGTFSPPIDLALIFCSILARVKRKPARGIQKSAVDESSTKKCPPSFFDPRSSPGPSPDRPRAPKYPPSYWSGCR